MRVEADLLRLVSHYRQGGSLALFFDFDGTLAPLVTHPDLAVCSSVMEQLLASLALLPRVIVGVLSGRTLENLKTKICLPNLVYAGTFGLEMQLPQDLFEHPDARRYAPVVSAAQQAVVAIIEDYPGAWIEQKPLAFTVHYRQVERDLVPFLHQSIEICLARFESVLVSVDGSMAIEVLPDVGWEKGEALHTIIERDGRAALPLYAGNDDNDAGAMQAAMDLGGVAIGVSPAAPPFATECVSDPESLEELLGELSKLLREERAEVRRTGVVCEH